MLIQTEIGLERFFQGIAYIEAHLWEDFSLEDVAGAAAWSPYHYARLFRAVANDSVMAYARRRRLTEAALRIVLEKERLIDIALDCQFGSQEAFTRAFAKQMGLPPGNLRNTRQLPFMRLQSPVTLEMLNHINNRSISMKPEIIEFAGASIIGIPRNFTFSDSLGIAALWGEYEKRVENAVSKKPTRFYGAVYDIDHENGKMVYMAAIGVGDYNYVPEGFERLELVAGTYAKFTHHSSGIENLAEEIKQTYTYIFGKWLPSSKYRHTPLPEFESYDDSFDMDNATGEVDIYIPVVLKNK